MLNTDKVGGGECGKKSPIYPQMLTSCEVHPPPGFENFWDLRFYHLKVPPPNFEHFWDFRFDHLNPPPHKVSSF